MGIKTNLFLLSGITSILISRQLPDHALFGSFLATFSLLFSVQLIAYTTYAVIVYPLFISPLRHLPEPPGASIINGHLKQILAQPSGEPAKEWVQTVPNEGLIRYRHAFNRERVLVVSPRALGEVLVTKNYDFIKPKMLRNGIGQLLGFGILLAEGEEHKRQRKNLMPAFAFRHVKDLYQTFWAKGREVTDKMVETIQASADSTGSAVLEVGDWASRVTLDIIGVAGMGRDFKAIQNPETELNVCYRSVFQPNSTARIMGLIGLVVPFWILRRLPLKRNQEVYEARALIRRVCQDLINEKRYKLENEKLTDKDILSVAITSGGFSDENLIDQLMTFLAAGHETTASAMMWACYLLCRNPDVQKRLRDDIRSNLPSISDPNSEITSADIDRLHYLHAVCNEVLRFVPSVPLTLRTAAIDTTIVDKPIPKDTTIIICPWAVNNSKELWGPDADKFNPDRWMAPGAANTGGADSNYSFLTFLHGPRSCIGKDFAKAEYAILLASWVGRFEMEFEDKDYVLEIVGGVTSKPKGGLKVRLTPLEGW